MLSLSNFFGKPDFRKTLLIDAVNVTRIGAGLSTVFFAAGGFANRRGKQAKKRPRR
jgi:hypothetical protein